MNYTVFMRIIRTNAKSIILAGFLVAVLAFAVSAFITPKYETLSSILVIQKQPEDKVDAFSAAKSAEYLSNIFSKIIFTDSFIEDVLKSPVGVKNQYSSDKEERKKEWERKVKVKKVNNTGIIEIAVYDPSRLESQKISQAIVGNISANHMKYHGGGDKITVSPIDGPTISKNPVPNVWLNALLGFLMGILGFSGYLYFKNDFFSQGNEDYPFSMR